MWKIALTILFPITLLAQQITISDLTDLSKITTRGSDGDWIEPDKTPIVIELDSKHYLIQDSLEVQAGAGTGTLYLKSRCNDRQDELLAMGCDSESFNYKPFTMRLIFRGEQIQTGWCEFTRPMTDKASDELKITLYCVKRPAPDVKKSDESEKSSKKEEGRHRRHRQR